MNLNEIELLDPVTIPHHDIASLHRSMNDMEFEALKLDIESNGQLIPIITYKGKLVDGRHRQRALIELGIHDIKTMRLPGNISLKEVKERVMSTENRRTDNASQKSIRAYEYYKSSYGESTQEEVAIKFAVTQTSISKVKKLESLIGSEAMQRFYKNGYIHIGDKRHTQIRTAISALKNTELDHQDNDLELSKTLSDAFDLLSAMAKTGDVASIARIAKRAKNYLQSGELI